MKIIKKGTEELSCGCTLYWHMDPIETKDKNKNSGALIKINNKCELDHHIDDFLSLTPVWCHNNLKLRGKRRHGKEKSL